MENRQEQSENPEVEKVELPEIPGSIEELNQQLVEEEALKLKMKTAREVISLVEKDNFVQEYINDRIDNKAGSILVELVNKGKITTEKSLAALSEAKNRMVKTKDKADEKYIAVWAKHFTQEDLDVIKAFYSTETGKKFNEKLIQTANECNSVLRSWGKYVSEPLINAITEAKASSLPDILLSILEEINKK